MIFRFHLYICFLLACFASYGTHIRGGEIKVERISNSTLTYKISVIGFSNLESHVEFGNGEVDMGDGNTFDLVEVITEDPSYIQMEEQMSIITWVFQYTYSNPGRYIISYSEHNRNAGVVNMGNSVDTPFYLETSFLIDPIVGVNNIPFFTVPPELTASTFTRYISSLTAVDIDGDSLSYDLGVPKKSLDAEADDYRFPHEYLFYPNHLAGNEDQTGPATLQISGTGVLVWDAPGMIGEYAILVRVKEWRRINGQWQELSSVSRDFSIIVTDSGLPGPTPLLVGGQVKETMHLYPNPFTSKFFVEFQGDFKEAWLFDLSGKNWGQINPGVNDFWDLPKGIYLVKWNKREAIRIVKN